MVDLAEPSLADSVSSFKVQLPRLDVPRWSEHLAVNIFER
jgi:hypothetical protein